MAKELRFSYTVEADIPEGLREYYDSQGDGDDVLYVLTDLKGAVSSSEHAELDKKLRRQKQDLTTMQRQRDEAVARIPEGFDEDEYAAWTAAGKPMSGSGGAPDAEKLKEIREAAELKASNAYKGKLETAEGTATRVTGTLRKLLREQALTDAMQEAKILAPYQKAVKAMFLDQVIVTEHEPDEEGGEFTYTTAITGASGPEAVKDFLTTWAATEEGSFYAGDGGDGGGGGARKKGSQNMKGQKNPWVKSTYNVTEQSRIMRESPELAKSMKAQAAASP